MAERQLHPGAKWAFRVRGLFTVFFLTFFFGIWSSPFMIMTFGSKINLAGILIYLLFLIIIAVVIIEIYSRLSYRFWKYEFTDSQLRIERGIIWKRYSNIPYERIQNVDITRGIIARLCCFSTVNIQTAGYSVSRNGAGMSTEGYLPAVSIEEAEKIREFVIKKITKKSRSGL
ncbi:MAG: PH domain-containing protein [Nanoarchaeota archaeon]